jgi:DNA-binding PadR family transcriptional regulator
VKRLTATSYAILGLLALRPWSAYELSKQMARNVGEYWPRAERGIYDEAKNLVAHAYATAADEKTGLRPRTIYSITKAGRRALRNWLSESSAPPQFESEAILRIAFAEQGSRKDALRTLTELREQIAERRRLITDVARDYVEGRGPYPNRVPIIAVVSRFFADYYALMDDWASWAARQLELDPDDEAHASALAVLAEIGALRSAATT